MTRSTALSSPGRASSTSIGNCELFKDRVARFALAILLAVGVANAAYEPYSIYAQTRRERSAENANEPRVKQLTKVVMSVARDQKGLEFKTTTDVPGFSEISVSTSPPTQSRDFLKLEPINFHGVNTLGVSQGSAEHMFKVPFSELKDNQKYYYVIRISAVSRRHVDITGTFTAHLPHILD